MINLRKFLGATHRAHTNWVCCRLFCALDIDYWRFSRFNNATIENVDGRELQKGLKETKSFKTIEFYSIEMSKQKTT